MDVQIYVTTGLVISIITVLSAFAGIMKYVIRAELERGLRDGLAQIKEELSMHFLTTSVGEAQYRELHMNLQSIHSGMALIENRVERLEARAAK
jgi:hypothetical protein